MDRPVSPLEGRIRMGRLRDSDRGVFYQPYPTHYAGTLPKADLDRYVARHAQTCGEAVDTATLIPHMALMDGNRGFKQRKA